MIYHQNDFRLARFRRWVVKCPCLGVELTACTLDYLCSVTLRSIVGLLCISLTAHFSEFLSVFIVCPLGICLYSSILKFQRKHPPETLLFSTFGNGTK